MKKRWKKLLAGLLAAALCLPLSAGALTAEQLKELLGEYYLNDIPQAVLDGETVEDILAALNDPYTMYMDAETFDAFMNSMRDETVVGIGISCLTHEAGMEIVSVYEGSPAEKIGLVPGDIVTAVEGHEAAGCDATLIASWLRGEEGSDVTFTIRHADGSEATYTTQRAKVIIPATTTELLENGTTGYIVCDTFGEETLGHVTEGTMAYDDANLWMVDLRSNSGGDVYAVTQVLGAFLGKGTMVYLRDSDDELYRYVSQQDSTTIHPVIALVSGQTASSAEIFALAVKDKNGGMVIGSNTYGKGIAQIILTHDQLPEVLTDDALRITAYQYYGTSLSTANTIGVIPDLLVNTNDADEIAALFSTQEPGDSEGWARIHLGGWRWYVDLENAATEENAPYFTEMLEAIAPGCKVYLGNGEKWKASSPAELAAVTGMTDYTPRAFSDVAGLDCEKAANTLRTFLMLSGYPDGTFRPENPLTRGELCAVLTQAMRLRSAPNAADFSDVRAGDWFYEHVQAVVGAGYMQGTGNGKFKPEATVTREELYTVMGRLASALNLNFYRAGKAVPEDTGVPADYSDWAEPWVWLLAYSQKNILGQTLSMLPVNPAEVAPREAASRGETACVLYMILNAADVIDY